MKYQMRLSLLLVLVFLTSVAGRVCAAPTPDRIVEYKAIDDAQLTLHIFNPSGHQSTDKRPVIVFFFGGGWNGGTTAQFYKQSQHLASRGMVSICADYRVKSRHKTSPRECVKDGKSAIRWIRSHASELGIDPNQLAAGGGSAGGHVAAATATTDKFDEAGEDVSVNCRPNALVLFNPVFDNGPEGYGYDRVKNYWREISPLHNLDNQTPPTIVFLGTEDALIPVATAERYKKKMEAAGRRCDLHLFEGQKHGFFNKSKSNDTTILMDKFLVSLGYLKPAPSLSAHTPANEFDIVVYGGTSAGVIAAVQAKRMGKSVVIVGPDKQLGGLSSGGLGRTDSGNKAVVGGLAREFYHRIWRHYDEDPDAWRWQAREAFGDQGLGSPKDDGEERTMWLFEPHVAEQVFEDFVKENNILVHRDQWLDRENGVEMNGSRIQSITMLDGRSYRGKMFLDATYEGDLMAAAGVTYHVGREAESVYGEKWGGVRKNVHHHAHHFATVPENVSPFVVPGDSTSGLLPRISPNPPSADGAGDKKIQAYCFRTCLTNHDGNRVPFTKPVGYDPAQYELLVRIYQGGWRETFQKFDLMPNLKTDTNNHGPMSSDNIGFNFDYPDASYKRRRAIIKEHETYQKGWYYFIATDPRIPDDVQEEMNRWGLARDEFVNTDHWPHQLYVREARRMVGEFVMTEHEVLNQRSTAKPVGMGSYTLDSHNVQRYVTEDGFVQNEGDIGVRTNGAYPIAYGSLVPKKPQCTNLLVPVCASTSHIAFGSIRMEPVFMVLGQSAATAAAIAVEQHLDVQDVPYRMLRSRLESDHQIVGPQRK